MIGIYGVMSYAVKQRVHEIAIRMALGASAGEVLSLLLCQGLSLVRLGIAMGLMGAAWLTGTMESLLFGVKPAWDDHARYPSTEKQPIPGSGLEQAMLWTVHYGKGRAFVTTLGHDPDAMKSTLARGAEWAAIGDVTIPLPEELR